MLASVSKGFQFLGIPPKGEHGVGGRKLTFEHMFPISRDPPEGGTKEHANHGKNNWMFPISRDPPEGGTSSKLGGLSPEVAGFQFLGIPPKGERPKDSKRSGVYV